EGVKEELAVPAGRACFASEKDDVAHRFDGAEVVRLYRHRQRGEEGVEGEALAALPAHCGDLDHQLIGPLVDRLAAFVDQLATGVGVDRCSEMHDVSSHVCSPLP